MRVFGFVGVLAGLFVATATAQEAVEIKLANPRAGDRVKVTIEEKAESKLAATVMGMEQAKNEVKTKSIVYVDETIDADGKTKRATKLKRTYEKAVLGADGNDTKLSVEGKTVLIEKKGDKYAFSVDGKEVEADALKLLDGEFNKGGKEGARELMFPDKPVKPGDTWKIAGDKLVKSFGEQDLKMDPAKASATGKLVKAYKKDGKQFGVLELSVAAPITDLGPKVPVKLSEGNLSVTFTGDGVIDGSSPQGKSTAVTKIKVVGSGNGVDLTVEATVNETRTTEPLPKK